MAHYAFLDANSIVVEVINGPDEGEGHDWEQHYTQVRGQTCKRTSYNTLGGVNLVGGTPFRKNYAGIGYVYDSSLDAFIPPKPFESWWLNESTGLWEPPVPRPNDGIAYLWDETTRAWVHRAY